VIDGPDADGLPPDVSVILNTHTHGDHIGVNRAFAAQGRLGDIRVYGSAAAAEPIPGLTDAVTDGDVVAVGDLRGRVLRTDGHQTGHVCYVFDDALFCGDTLFAGGCGYLFDGPPAAMFDSLTRLAALPGRTRVCCAHEYTEDNLRFAWFVEPDNEALAARIRDVWARRARGETVVPSTIAEERATNPFLRPGSPGILRRLSALGILVDPRDPGAVFAALRQLKNQRPHLAPDAPPLPEITP
jgi:hydroxyacylglutathione hydrolase